MIWTFSGTLITFTTIPNLTYSIGGVTIAANGTAIGGGLAASGAATGDIDEECVRAALAKVRDRLS